MQFVCHTPQTPHWCFKIGAELEKNNRTYRWLFLHVVTIHLRESQQSAAVSYMYNILLVHNISC